jgi:ATP-dependent DNA helicase HFM1/MER3
VSCVLQKFQHILTGDRIGNIIKKYSEKKPIMVFCATQRMAEQTAMSLAEWWASSKPSDRYWNPPAVDIPVRNDKLKSALNDWNMSLSPH